VLESALCSLFTDHSLDDGPVSREELEVEEELMSVGEFVVGEELTAVEAKSVDKERVKEPELVLENSTVVELLTISDALESGALCSAEEETEGWAVLLVDSNKGAETGLLMAFNAMAEKELLLEKLGIAGPMLEKVAVPVGPMLTLVHELKLDEAASLAELLGMPVDEVKLEEVASGDTVLSEVELAN